MRHGCKGLINLEIVPQPPAERAGNNPWPQWPRIFRVDYGHAEVAAVFGEDPRLFSTTTVEFLGNDKGEVRALKIAKAEPAPPFKVVPGTEREIPADLVFLALGFLGPESPVADQLGVKLDPRSNYEAAHGQFTTNVPGVFAAGDCRRGQSLIVWAINEGRGAARECDRYLMGKSDLP
jgi:glutamate synthase (NADPH/NADH) small chain